MKAQCDDHGCSELLCGCRVQELEDRSDFCKLIRAKDHYINQLLDEIEELKQGRTLTLFEYKE